MGGFGSQFENALTLSEKSSGFRFVMDNISWLEQFYLRLCDGDWEHGRTCRISTIDNPGWSFEFNLTDTKLSINEFPKLRDMRSEDDWLHCEVKQSRFYGWCGPQNLNEMLSVFRNWVEENLDSKASPWAE